MTIVKNDKNGRILDIIDAGIVEGALGICGVFTRRTFKRRVSFTVIADQNFSDEHHFVLLTIRVAVGILGCGRKIASLTKLGSCKVVLITEYFFFNISILKK